jgi:Transposase C of IS166 homeodomain
MALIAQQKLRIAKLEHQVYGQRSERSTRLIDQLALTFEELEASATEDELAAETRRVCPSRSAVSPSRNRRASRRATPGTSQVQHSDGENKIPHHCSIGSRGARLPVADRDALRLIGGLTLLSLLQLAIDRELVHRWTSFSAAISARLTVSVDMWLASQKVDDSRDHFRCDKPGYNRHPNGTRNYS